MTQQIQSIPMDNLQHFINSTPSALCQAATQKILTASRCSQIPQTSMRSDHISSCVQVIQSALSVLYCLTVSQMSSCSLWRETRPFSPPHCLQEELHPHGALWEGPCGAAVGTTAASSEHWSIGPHPDERPQPFHASPVYTLPRYE